MIHAHDRIDPLLPDYTYERDRERIVRAVAKLCARRGWWPTEKELLGAHDQFAAKPLQDYVRTLEADGLVEVAEDKGIHLTAKGWASINTEPIEALKPTGIYARKAFDAYERDRLRNKKLREKYGISDTV